ncbi:MAG: signal recognition particle receptor subunit alpha [Candidatus Aenigmatarchaeota archaeon]
MLEKLSEGLKGALRKITGAGYIDKNVLDELANDIQKTLIASDVDVKLAFDLTERIKNRALNERPPAGLTAKEHVIKIVYEELVKLVGKKSEITLKPGKIIFVGLYGSGKCIHKDSLVTLSNGSIYKIEDLFKIYETKGTIQFEDGFVINTSNCNIKVNSLNKETLKIEDKKVIALWKLKSPKILYKISLDNGLDHSIIVTPEHPFLTLSKGELKWVRADSLNKDKFIAVPNTLLPNNQPNIYLRNLILENLHDDMILYDKEVSIVIKNKIKEIYKSVKSCCRELNLPFNYYNLTTMLKNGKVPIKLIKNIDKNLIQIPKNLIIKCKNDKKFVHFPSFLTPQLSEFLGYVISEGNIEPGVIHIHNKSNEILSRIDEISLNLFNLKPTKLIERTGTVRLTLASKTLFTILDSLFHIKDKNSDNARIPELILESNNDVIKGFLTAYIDGEGYIDRNSRYVEISSASKTLIHQLGIAFLRFGILSSYSFKTVNGKKYYRLYIKSSFVEKLLKSFNLLIPYKKRNLLNSVIIGKLQSSRSQEMIDVGNCLMEVRESYGASIGNIQKFVNSYGHYEKDGSISRNSLKKFLYALDSLEKNWLCILRLSKNGIRYDELLFKFKNRGWLNAIINRLVFLKYIQKIDNKYYTTNIGIKKLESIKQIRKKLKILNKLVFANVSWIKIKNISAIESDSEFVYDMTVEDNHNFIANGIIVHNTTSIGKLARFYQKRGLRPALIGCDVHRPAAMDQLIQLASQINVPCYAPKDITDPIEISKNGIEKFKKYDILIFDASGRSSLDNELAEELKKLANFIKPDEVLLTIPADLGQAAGEQAEGFKKLVGITGIFLTKMDGTARGGGAITSCAVTGAPIKFIGTGEKIDTIEVFDPERFISRLIGFGDIQGLLEKAKEAEIKPETAEKIIEGKFTMNEFLEQLQSMKKMGSLKNLMNMIPGLPIKISKELDLDKQEEKMKKWSIIIQSMTKEERENPNIIDASRIKRIAKGSGVSEAEVRDLLKYYEQTKKIVKMFSGGMKRGLFSKFAKRFKGF